MKPILIIVILLFPPFSLPFSLSLWSSLCVPSSMLDQQSLNRQLSHFCRMKCCNGADRRFNCHSTTSMIPFYLFPFLLGGVERSNGSENWSFQTACIDIWRCRYLLQRIQKCHKMKINLQSRLESKQICVLCELFVIHVQLSLTDIAAIDYRSSYDTRNSKRYTASVVRLYYCICMRNCVV